MKLAFLFGEWSVGNKPLNYSNLWTSPRALTGSDLGVSITAKEMAALGHDVSLFTVHDTDQLPSPWEGVKLYHIRDAQGVINSNPFDAIISWSEPDILRGLPSKPIKIVCQMLNDFSYCQSGFDEAVDFWTAPCQMLIDHLMTKPGAPAKHKFNALPLGCDPSWYNDQRIPGRVVWTSSPDRGLHWLLQEWPTIKKAVPFADLRIFYNFNYSSTEDMEPSSQNHPHFLEMGNRARYMKEAIKRLKDFGVLQLGAVSRERLQQELSCASVFAFPCDTITFSEGFSVSTLEAHASYTVPVIAGTDCLGSVYQNSGAILIKTPIKEHLSEFSDAVIKALTDKSFANNIIKQCRTFAENHTWKQSAAKLEQMIINHPKFKENN